MPAGRAGEDSQPPAWNERILNGEKILVADKEAHLAALRPHAQAGGRGRADGNDTGIKPGLRRRSCTAAQAVQPYAPIAGEGEAVEGSRRDKAHEQAVFIYSLAEAGAGGDLCIEVCQVWGCAQAEHVGFLFLDGKGQFIFTELGSAVGTAGQFPCGRIGEFIAEKERANARSLVGGGREEVLVGKGVKVAVGGNQMVVGVGVRVAVGVAGDRVG